jgi:hypothetical protein
MKFVVRALSELGAEVVLAPERWLATGGGDSGVPLGELVIERRERSLSADAVVLDTTHAKSGILDIHAALRASPSAKSAKKRACVGDLVVSRLRPYLRQIALVHPRALETTQGRELALSSEFYVLQPRPSRGGLAYLLPFLLASHAQGILAAAQEGGHHPRVPRSSLLALRVPDHLIQSRQRLSREVDRALEALYSATAHYEEVLSLEDRRSLLSRRAT